MIAGDEEIYSAMIRVESKDLFIDLRRNKGGTYLKLSERYGKARNSVLIPASGIVKLKNALETILSDSALQILGRTQKTGGAGDGYQLHTRSIYVSDLSWSTTSAELAEHFGSVGIVVKANVLHRTRQGKAQSLGCGVVEFQRLEDAARALEQLNGSELGGRNIKCREDRQVLNGPNGHSSAHTTTNGSSGQVSSQGTPESVRRRGLEGAGGSVARPHLDFSMRTAVPTKVFVNGLPWETQSEDLLAIFGTVGKVVAVDVAATKKGRSLGRAIVEFSAAEDASRAIAELNGRLLENRAMIVRAYYE